MNGIINKVPIGTKLTRGIIMNVLVLVALGVATGFGASHEWAGVKAYKSYNECRAENPKFQNTMTQWKYDPCNLVAYKLQNK